MLSSFLPRISTLGVFTFARMKPPQLLGAVKLFEKMQEKEQPREELDQILKDRKLRQVEEFKYGFTAQELEDANEMIKTALCLNNATQSEIEKYRIQKAIEKYQQWPMDTASPGVTVAVLSERLISLILHLSKNRKDFKAVRQFTILMSRRRRFLNFLMRYDFALFQRVVADYGIVHKSSGNHKEYHHHKHKQTQKKKDYDRKEPRQNYTHIFRE